jgi:(S)-ureidoglycine aminohydrolase
MHTRGRRGPAYTLLTPENHYASRLPNLRGARIIKLVTPRLHPARFGQYLLTLPEEDMDAGVNEGFENSFFGLAGQAELRWRGGATVIEIRMFAYIPPQTSFALSSRGAGRLLWLKRRYEPWPSLASPGPRGGHADEIAAAETDTPGLRRRELLDPADPRLDFNMSLMSFEAGVALPFVEIHDEEHGLYMTAGDGSYALDGDEHAVREGDFIYMAPYCPQWFRAGVQGAAYLLYKDVYRDGFSFADAPPVVGST